MRYLAARDGMIQAREVVLAERCRAYPRVAPWWRGIKLTTVMPEHEALFTSDCE